MDWERVVDNLTNIYERKGLKYSKNNLEGEIQTISWAIQQLLGELIKIRNLQNDKLRSELIEVRRELNALRKEAIK